jgi:hypothetical protein
MLSDNHPCPLATLAQQRVELSAAYRDGATVGKGHRATGRFDRGHKGAFGR